jgi:hypothetical protein
VCALLAELPDPEPITDPVANRASWTRWQAALRVRITLPAELPRLRLLLIWDNLAGHHTPALLLWLFAQGVMVLSTPLSGSWLNMAESLRRILVRRALAGQHPQTPQDIIDTLEATARAWDADPTPFVSGGRRAAAGCGHASANRLWGAQVPAAPARSAAVHMATSNTTDPLGLRFRRNHSGRGCQDRRRVRLCGWVKTSLSSGESRDREASMRGVAMPVTAL